MIPKPLLMFIGLVALLFIGYYLMFGSFPGLPLAAITGEDLCQNIYSYDFLYTCCVKKQTSPVTVNLNDYEPERSNLPWKCPADATECKLQLQSLGGLASYGAFCIAPATSACNRRETGAWPLKVVYWECTGAQCTADVEPGRLFTLRPGEFIYLRVTGQVDSYFTYIKHYQKLYSCQYSGCTVGANVPGAVGCAFVTNDKIWRENGQLATGTPVVGGIQYTVPGDYCYLSIDAGSRRLIGDTCEECEDTWDCARRYPMAYNYQGKDYGAVCHNRQIQLYDCVPTGPQVCIREVSGDGLTKCEEYGRSSKCDIVAWGVIAVECCTGDDCYSGICGDDFKCGTPKECSKATEARDCGAGIVCDWTQKKVVGKRCNEALGKCEEYTIQSVECCLDANCPSQWFCDSNYQCKEKPKVRTECPSGWECCVNEPDYFDKSCPPNKPYCCADHVCKVSCEGPILCDRDGTCEPEIGETKENCPSDCKGWFDINFTAIFLSIIAAGLVLWRMGPKPVTYLIAIGVFGLVYIVWAQFGLWITIFVMILIVLFVVFRGLIPL